MRLVRRPAFHRSTKASEIEMKQKPPKPYKHRWTRAELGARAAMKERDAQYRGRAKAAAYRLKLQLRQVTDALRTLKRQIYWLERWKPETGISGRVLGIISGAHRMRQPRKRGRS